MSKKGSKGKLRSIHIEPGANGYSVRAHHERSMAKESGPAMPMDMEEEKPHFFNNKDEVRDHVHGLMSAHEGMDDGEPDADDEHPLRKAIRRR